MDENGTPTSGPEPPIGERSPWEELILRVAIAAGLEPDPERVSLAARATADPTRPRAARLADACAELGLRAVSLRSTVAGVAASVGPEHPAVAWLPGGDAWLIVSDARARRLAVEGEHDAAPRWVARGDLAASLDPEAVGEVEWVAIDPPPLTEAAHREAGAAEISPLSRLRRLVFRERYDLTVVLVYAVGVGGLTLATPLAVQALVNTVAFGTLLQPVLVLALLLLAFLAFAAVLRSMQAWVVEILQRRIFLRVVGQLAHSLPRVSLSAFDRRRGPELLNRVFDVFAVQKSAATLLLGGLEIALTALAGMLVLAFYHPLLLAFDLALVALVAGILFALGRSGTGTAISESKAKYRVVAWLQEVSSRPVAFKLAAGPSVARAQTELLATDYLRARSAHYRVVYRQLVAALAVQALASAALLGLGGWLVVERQLTLGQLVASELIVTGVVASLAKLGKHLETYYDLVASLDKVGQVLDLPLEPTSHGHPLASPPPAGASVLLADVAVAFDGGSASLAGVALQLAPGERVALLGSSGGGRRVLLEVLAGLREADRGRIELDGVDVRDADRFALRGRVGLVREAELIGGTLLENVAFGRPEIGAAEAREALRRVGMLDDVARLPNGLQTMISPTGSPLSAGQAMRVTLARAIAGRPSLLLVDRALDVLDPASRDAALDALLERGAPWTLLLATDLEELATRCTRRLSLRDGQLTEEGEA